MNSRICLPALGLLLLGGCSSDTVPDGAVLLDEQVALNREEHVDFAQREIEVGSDSVLVAIVEEQMTDVTVKLAAVDSSGNSNPVEVENNLRGAGIEVATLDVPRSSRIRVTLTSPHDANAPGRVHLRIRRFDKATANYAAQLLGFKAWSAATNASQRVDAIKKSGLAAMDRAIASLDSVHGDAAFAAEARLIKANMYLYFQVDWREARAEAQHAAQAFGALPTPDALNEARASYIEARALVEISADRAAVDPTADEAATLARATLDPLSAPNSILGPIERARVVRSLGHLGVNTGKLDDARLRFEAALAIYHAAGFSAGEREMQGELASVFLERGQFHDAAGAYDAVLPVVDRIADPDYRVTILINAARAEALSGRVDEATENLLKALALSREFKLRGLEGRALQGLGNIYLNRADVMQARTYFYEALKINREEHDAMELVWGLASAGVVARVDGDYPHAIELHEEAVSLATNPVGRVRTLRELGLDYNSAGDYPAAIAAYRESLAVKLEDPRHHAYSDVKRNLAQVLIEHGDDSAATLEEAGRLLDENLQSCLRVGDKLGEVGAHRLIGALLAKQGRFTKAQTEYELSFTLARELREKSASAEARVATFGHEQNAFRGYLDLMLKEVAARGANKSRPASKREEAALRRLELARDENFGAARTGELDTATTARVDVLLGQMADKSLKIAALLRREINATETARLETLQLEISNLRVELDRLRTAAAAKRVELEKARPPTARDWRRLGPGVVQLSYALGNDHAYAWARSAAGILVTVLARAPKDLERELTELGGLDRQVAPDRVEQALEQVSAVLLPAGLLPEESTGVQIVAEGRIAGVPFAGLRSPVSSQRAVRRRLVETHAITMITSMFSVEELPRPKQARPFRLVALASGSGTLRSAAVADAAPKLQAATKEIRTVAALFTARDPAAKVKLLTGPEGSAAALRNIWGSGADVVHFATHAMADLRQPLASLLVLPATDAAGASTYLTAGQVEAWRGDAELVFLSACESAIGPPRFAGGMPGLQRAFLRAGARGVIATLWPIEDVLAQEFSADFYQRFTQGQSASQALSETQRAWLAPKPGASDAEQIRRRITALAHGFYTQ